MKGKRRRGRKKLLDDTKKNRVLEIDRGSTRSQSVENLLWTCLKTDNRMGGVLYNPTLICRRHNSRTSADGSRRKATASRWHIWHFNKKRNNAVTA